MGHLFPSLRVVPARVVVRSININKINCIFLMVLLFLVFFCFLSSETVLIRFSLPKTSRKCDSASNGLVEVKIDDFWDEVKIYDDGKRLLKAMDVVSFFFVSL